MKQLCYSGAFHFVFNSLTSFRHIRFLIFSGDLEFSKNGLVNLKTFLEIQILVCNNEILHVSLNAGSFMVFLLHFDFDIHNDT